MWDNQVTNRMISTSSSLFEILKSATCIVLDVEGTTTSFDFVRNELFTYGEKHIEDYVLEHWRDPEVQSVVKELMHEDGERAQFVLDNSTTVENFTRLKMQDIQKAAISQLLSKMKSGNKTSAIKELEGLVWKNGFLNGSLIGHVYPDVADALSLWSSQGKTIFIYSTGSIEAQRLLFRHSTVGNLEKYLHGNFDTNIGSKLDPISYSEICQNVCKLPSETVFFSDRPKEIFAAKQAGLHAVLVVRDANQPNFLDDMDCLTVDDLRINSFLEVISEVHGKN